MKRIWGSHFSFPFLGARNSAQGAMEDSDSLCGARRWLATVIWSFGLPDADWSEPNFKWTPIAGNVNYCEHLAEDATSKPVYGFQYFWRDRASSFWPQSQDSNFHPNLAVLFSRSKLRRSRRLGAPPRRPTTNAGKRVPLWMVQWKVKKIIMLGRCCPNKP